jgi:hypothetical protein
MTTQPTQPAPAFNGAPIRRSPCGKVFCADCVYLDSKLKRCHRLPPWPNHNYNLSTHPYIDEPSTGWCGQAEERK